VELCFHGSDQGLADAVEEVARSVHIECSVRLCIIARAFLLVLRTDAAAIRTPDALHRRIFSAF
jgi:hypothetical protein